MGVTEPSRRADTESTEFDPKQREIVNVDTRKE
jgi:hypothetical protein